MKAGNRSVEITSATKILFPESNYTKADLIAYYNVISEHIIPFLRNRPLMLHRFPQGITNAGFYQKAITDAFPDWINRVEIAKEKQEPIEQAMVNNKASLLYLINQNTIVLHPWLSTAKNLHKPDKLIFDLDPEPGQFPLAVKGAFLLRSLLKENYNFTSYVMTTGSSGLHVTVPLKGLETFEEIRPFTHQIGLQLSELHPEQFTTEQRIEDRKGRLFIDYLRNSYAQTAVAPYSVRAIAGAPVAAPLFWEELKDKSLTAQKYTIKTMPERLKKQGNPWQDFRENAKSLKQANSFNKNAGNNKS